MPRPRCGPSPTRRSPSASSRPSGLCGYSNPPARLRQDVGQPVATGCVAAARTCTCAIGLASLDILARSSLARATSRPTRPPACSPGRCGSATWAATSGCSGSGHSQRWTVDELRSVSSPIRPTRRLLAATAQPFARSGDRSRRRVGNSAGTMGFATGHAVREPLRARRRGIHHGAGRRPVLRTGRLTWLKIDSRGWGMADPRRPAGSLGLAARVVVMEWHALGCPDPDPAQHASRSAGRAPATSTSITYRGDSPRTGRCGRGGMRWSRRSRRSGPAGSRRTSSLARSAASGAWNVDASPARPRPAPRTGRDQVPHDLFGAFRRLDRQRGPLRALGTAPASGTRSTPPRRRRCSAARRPSALPSGNAASLVTRRRPWIRGQQLRLRAWRRGAPTVQGRSACRQQVGEWTCGLVFTLNPGLSQGVLMEDATLTIGQVAERAGINSSAIRYYERVGLLPRTGAPRRSAPLHRTRRLSGSA